MAGRGPQTFKKRQKEQQRKEKQQEKMARRLQRTHHTLSDAMIEALDEEPFDGELFDGETLADASSDEDVVDRPSAEHSKLPHGAGE
jgi:hypothetical protein